MQAQGISLVTAGPSQEVTAAQPIKANDTTFESFMATHASQAERVVSPKKKTEISDKKEESSQPMETQKPKSVSADGEKAQMSDKKAGNDTRADSLDGQKEKELPEELVDVSMLVVSLTEMLQSVFGMNEEQAQDVLNQMEMNGIDLTGVLAKAASGEDSMGALWELMQNVVMTVHGIEDKVAFVTNDVLNQELETCKEQVETLFAQLQESVSGAVMKEQASQTVGEDADAFDETLFDTSLAAGKETAAFDITVETETESDEFQRDSQSAQTEEGLDTEVEKTVSHGSERAATAFTERLTEAFETVRGDSVREPAQVMSRIVEQVVSQVRIRVMPETTNMELMLHPASLGRVSVSVSAAASGMSTAVMTVENQIAKEALESQLILLKQSFEEQGLKVDSVEVTVSDFGFHSENRDASASGQQNGQSGRQRRFRADVGDGAVSGKGTEDKETEQTRRDVNSVVDYTA